MQKKHQKEDAVSHSYSEVKKLALQNPLLRKQVKIGDIKVVDENRIEYKGTELALSDRAFDSLIKRLGVPVSFQNRVNKLLGPQAKVNLLNSMKTAVSAHKNKTLMFIGNPTESKIVGVTENTSMLSAKSFFDLVEDTIGQHDLRVKSCSIGTYGNVNIQAVSAHAAGIKGLPAGHADDEGFNPGLSFSNSIFNGTELNPYTYRLICNNGMIALDRHAGIRIGGFDTEELKKFYAHIATMAANNFVSANYNAQVLKAINSYASLGELQFMSNVMKNQSGVDSNVINRFVPYFDCVKKYEALNIKVDRLDKSQLANAKTNVKVWDAINGLTDFASHKYDGVDISSAGRAQLQHSAGAILNKEKFDTMSLMPSLV